MTAVRCAGAPHGYVLGDGRVAASPRRPSRPGSRRATTLIAGRSPAACASTCPPARARPAPSTHCRRRSDPPCGGADPAGRTCRRSWRCVAGSVPPRAPAALKASRRMPAVAVEPMRSTCRSAARRWGSFCPRRRGTAAAREAAEIVAAPARISRKDGGDRTLANPWGRERTAGVGWPATVRQPRYEALLIALQSLTTEGDSPVRSRVAAGLACFRPARTGCEPGGAEGGVR